MDVIEFVDTCQTILQDCLWQRQYPNENDDMFDQIELPKEEQKFCNLWIDVALTDLLITAKYILAPDRVGLQKLLLQTMEGFINWAKEHGSADTEKAVQLVKSALPRVQSGSIFVGPDLEDPRLTPPEPPRQPTLEERNEWARRGRDADALLSRAESLQEEKLRLEREMEGAILLQKQDEARQAMEQQQRALLGPQYDEIQQMLRPGVFGAVPKKL